MELEFNKQILTIQNELNFLRSALTPMFQFMTEIQEIRRKHHISSSYNITNLSIISLEIKEDVLKDVSAMQAASEEKLNDYKLENARTFDELHLKIGEIQTDMHYLDQCIKDINNILMTLKINTGENSFLIKNVQRELDTKATITNIDEIRQVLKTMTPFSTFEKLKSKVGECVSNYEFNDSLKKLEKIHQKQKNFMKIEDLENKLKGFTHDLKNDFDHSYVTSSKFSEFNEIIELKFKETDEKINSTKEFSLKIDAVTNDKLKLLKRNLDSKPWKSETTYLNEQIELKVSISSLNAFTKETVESIKNFSKEMYNFKAQVEKFEKCLERFDEVLLDKAEKDETKKINEILLRSATLDSVIAIKNSVSTFTREFENKFQTQVVLVEKVMKNFDYILDKFEAMKKEIFDVTNLSTTVAEFKDAVERKADKQDIFELYDNTCKRIDFLEASENFKTLKKQVEQASALMFSLCRTLLKNGEPAASIKKQRYELLKNFNSLVNWINGENTAGGVHTSRIENYDFEDNSETRFPSRQSAFLRRRSAVTTKDAKRPHVDFPKIV